MVRIQRRSCVPLLVAAGLLLAGSARAADQTPSAAPATPAAESKVEAKAESKVKVEVVSLPAWSESGGGDSHPPIAAATLSQPAMAAVRAVIDPQTGQLRLPTREERQAWAESLKPLLSRSTKDLEMIVLDDGSEVIDLQERFMSMSVVSVRPDGALVTECITRPSAAAHAGEEDDHVQ